MRDEQEIAEIVIQLQRLQLQQSELLHRLAQSEVNNNTAEQASTASTAPPASAPREFVIGDQVRIVNPNPFQANKGRIIRIGDRITVLTKNGTKIQRAAKNLVIEE